MRVGEGYSEGGPLPCVVGPADLKVSLLPSARCVDSRRWPPQGFRKGYFASVPGSLPRPFTGFTRFLFTAALRHRQCSCPFHGEELRHREGSYLAQGVSHKAPDLGLNPAFLAPDPTFLTTRRPGGIFSRETKTSHLFSYPACLLFH